MSGLQLGLVDHVGHCAMHPPATRRGRIDVDPAGQQWVRVTHPVAGDLEDSAALHLFEKRCHALGGRTGGAGEHVHRRLGHAGGGQKRVLGVMVQAGDPDPHELGKRTGQVGFGVDRPGHFQRVERIAAGYLGDPHHCRPGERAAEPGAQQFMQAAQAQRAHPRPGDSVGAGELQPGHHAAAVRIGALGDDQSHPAPQSPRHERHHRLARRVEPLHVVDPDHDRCVGGQRLDGRQQRRGHDVLIGFRSAAGLSQQHPVHGDALHFGKLLQRRGVDVGQQVGDRAVGEHGLGLPRPRRQHTEALCARLLQGCQPQCGLPDARLALDQEARGLLTDRREELGNRAQLDRPAHHTD